MKNLLLILLFVPSSFATSVVGLGAVSKTGEVVFRNPALENSLKVITKVDIKGECLISIEYKEKITNIPKDELTNIKGIEIEPDFVWYDMDKGVLKTELRYSFHSGGKLDFVTFHFEDGEYSFRERISSDADGKNVWLRKYAGKMEMVQKREADENSEKPARFGKGVLK